MSKTLQLAQLFRHAIEQGQLRAGDRLPSLRRLCQDHGVSLTTAQRAYAELERQGLLQALPRSGFRVCTPAAALRPAEPASDGVLRMEHLTTALPMPWGCPFINPALINTTQMNRALSRALQDYRAALSSTPIEGFEGLRRELGLHYLSQGITLAGDELLITCGGMEALTLAMRAAVSASGSHSMVVVTPAFPAALEQLRHLGISMLPLALSEQGCLDLEALDKLLQQQRPAGIVLMANFQHPTGLLLPETQKRALVALAERHRVCIIEDDTYRELYFGTQGVAPLKAYDRSGTVLHCSSFSKSLAPGYRVGWIAAGRLSNTVRGLKLCSSLGTPLPSQMALARLLASGQHGDMLTRLRASLRSRRDAMQEQIKESFPAGSRLLQPEGGYFQWVILPEGLDCAALLPMAIEQGIHYAPSTLFYPQHGPSNALRLNFSFFDPLHQREGVALLGALLRQAQE
ncbi:PLP-dependent aminotransferase family protein [Aquitalea palustris]|uniref:Putative 8-amino-7-oxononanoate synthase n=2 Tax=Pseudomonadota TaxID=1224 RepID=A0A454JM31_9NEIS|nr:PLP-dependent aminotransferase family protein [Aquitalea palustris]RMD00989.1 PLP-dependent aminotransferase family protein [Aquitalea palustris]